MAAQPNIGGPSACEGSVIPFLAPRRKVWLTPAARVPCSNAANYEKAGLGRKLNFARGKIPSGARAAGNVYIEYQFRETAKYRAKFGWPPVSDVPL